MNRLNPEIMSKLESKVAVVTGAAKGIGAAIAKHFAAAGAKVVVNYASSKGCLKKAMQLLERWTSL